jgi:hypothetical protein
MISTASQLLADELGQIEHVLTLLADYVVRDSDGG